MRKNFRVATCAAAACFLGVAADTLDFRLGARRRDALADPLGRQECVRVIAIERGIRHARHFRLVQILNQR